MWAQKKWSLKKLWVEYKTNGELLKKMEKELDRYVEESKEKKVGLSGTHNAGFKVQNSPSIRRKRKFWLRNLLQWLNMKKNFIKQKPNQQILVLELTLKIKSKTTLHPIFQNFSMCKTNRMLV